MRKSGLFILAITLLFTQKVFTQYTPAESKKPWVEKGELYGVIFGNFHSDINNQETERGFEVKRAYLGYKVNLDDNLSANVKLDIGSPDDVSEYSLKKRFAYFKNAYLQYKTGKFSAQFGISDCQQFKVQEKFWGYRYIYQSFQDINKFGPSADLGIVCDYNLSDKIRFDASFLNGEGYSQVQTDEDFKMALGTTIKPLNFLTLRLYYDTGIAYKYNQSDLALFSGIHIKSFSLGGEFNYQWHNKSVQNHNMYGYSVYGTYMLNEQWKLFGRYDQVYSKILSGEIIPWNLSNDGSSIITGCEFSPKKYLQLSVNYKDKLAYAENGSDEHFIYFDIQISF